VERSQREDRVVTDRVALVTGSSRGLGRAIALELARAGHRVVIHYHSRREGADAVLHELGSDPARAIACQADLTDPSAADRLFEAASQAFGRVDVLVNNATPPILRKPVLECSWDDFAAFLDVYVRATLRLVQLAAPSMQSRRFGRIVNVLSTYAHGVPPPRLAPYVTAKNALAGLSRALAVELGPAGITVNTVAPSVLVTEQNAGLGDRARQLAAAQAPLRRLPELHEVAGAVAFLASDAASAITGAVLPVAAGDIMPA
jgi:3-oxoacyl-[acyl-carrier protein] reductase